MKHKITYIKEEHYQLGKYLIPTECSIALALKDNGYPYPSVIHNMIVYGTVKMKKV